MKWMMRSEMMIKNVKRNEGDNEGVKVIRK